MVVALGFLVEDCFTVDDEAASALGDAAGFERQSSWSRPRPTAFASSHWIDGDFFVGIGGPAEQLSTDEGFTALGVAVDGVESTLSN